MAGNAKRVGKEYAALTQDPIPGINVSLPDENNMLEWLVKFDGPKETPFEGGTFSAKLTLADNYPFKPPTLSFTTKIYHPNVSNDDKGSMCLGLLRPENWKPSTKLSEVLTFAYQVMREPNVDDAVEQAVAAEYRDHRDEWKKQAREWTKKYATGKS